MLPGLNFSVLDTNEVDSEATLARLVTEYKATRKRIVLPWVFLFEQMKGGREDWFYAVHERFRGCPQAFVWALSTAELHQEERRSQRRLRSVENRRQTVRFRRFLSDPGPLRRNLDFQATRARLAELFRFWSPSAALEIMMATFKFPQDELKKIRRDLQSGDRGALRDRMVWVVREYGRQFLQGHGLRASEARRLSLYPSFSLLTFVVLFYNAMRWHVRPPSKENLADQRWLDREVADMEALEVSLYGRELVTRDRRLLEVRDDLLEVVKTVW